MGDTLLTIAAIITSLAFAAGVAIYAWRTLRGPAVAGDSAAEQRIADLTGRVQAMGELLAKAQTQLQQTVHERLDAVTARLGESMQTSAKTTTEHLQQLHARLAVIDN